MLKLRPLLLIRVLRVVCLVQCAVGKDRDIFIGQLLGLLRNPFLKASRWPEFFAAAIHSNLLMLFELVVISSR